LSLRNGTGKSITTWLIDPYGRRQKRPTLSANEVFKRFTLFEARVWEFDELDSGKCLGRIKASPLGTFVNLVE
jgi:hypothetical protein